MVWGVLALAAASGLAPEAAAQPDEWEGRRRLRRGQALFDQGRFRQAARELEASYAAAPLPQTLLELGHAYRRAGIVPRAHATYLRLLTLHPDLPERAEVVKHIEEMTGDRWVPPAARVKPAAPPPRPPPAPPPAPPPPRRVIVFRHGPPILTPLTNEPVLFAPDSAGIPARADEALDRIIKLLVRRPAMVIEVRGFAEPTEKAGLAQARATAVIRELASRGADPARFVPATPAAPACARHDGDCRARSRRVEFFLAQPDAGADASRP